MRRVPREARPEEASHAERIATPLARNGKDEQRAAQRGVLRQFAVAAHGAQTFSRLLQARRHADTGPAANARVDADELLALVLVREHVADDPGRGLELPQFLAVLDAH